MKEDQAAATGQMKLQQTVSGCSGVIVRSVEEGTATTRTPPRTSSFVYGGNDGKGMIYSLQTQLKHRLTRMLQLTKMRIAK
jgi:hypothetical protein